MGELTVTLMRLGLLALLWLFVFSVVAVLRGDLYGTRVMRRPTTQAPQQPPTAAPPAKLSRSEQRVQAKAAKAGARVPTHLVVTEGPLTGTTLPLRESGTLIGRNPEASLVLDDDYASGRHMRLYRDDKGWVAEDLNSTNGTYLDGMKLTHASPVEVGSQLRIGKTVVELRR
jgi:pSer/pThr/pTyr-binding forkhead associated (FHA) protein